MTTAVHEPALHEHNKPKQHYSQFGQDMLVGDVLFRTRTGVFVDVGAMDGKVISNTFYLEQIGWSGVCIEPRPDLYEGLVANRTCRCVNTAAGAERATLDFVSFHNPGESGLRGTWRDSRRLETEPHEITQVPVVPLSELIADLPVVHYLDIDVEGHELEVLQGIDFDRTEFRIIGVETGLHTAEIDGYLSERGYRPFLTLRADRFYCPDDDLWTSHLVDLP